MQVPTEVPYTYLSSECDRHPVVQAKVPLYPLSYHPLRLRIYVLTLRLCMLIHIRRQRTAQGNLVRLTPYTHPSG